jgi:hypothetical protein
VLVSYSTSSALEQVAFSLPFLSYFTTFHTAS